MHQQAARLTESPPLDLPAVYTRFVTRFGVGEVATIVTTPAKWARSLLADDPGWQVVRDGRRLIATRLVL